MVKTKFKTIYFKIVYNNQIRYSKINPLICLGLLMSSKMQHNKMSLKQINHQVILQIVIKRKMPGRWVQNLLIFDYIIIILGNTVLFKYNSY